MDVETDITTMTTEYQQFAFRSRLAAAQRKQRARRRREADARRRGAEAYEHLRQHGVSGTCAAQRLCVSPRTLAHWMMLDHGCPARGRPCKESPALRRLEVLEYIHEFGPLIGSPTLRLTFPNVPRCELIDLQRQYRQYYVKNHRLSIEELTWHRVGAVWAIDHSEAPTLIDGTYPAILALRDLASALQLAWRPTIDQTGETTTIIVRQLIEEHGAPLVLKSDNGSAFKSHVFQQLLAEHDIVWLPSPPSTPRYNGACEAGIGSHKNATQLHAARHAGDHWTSDDLEAARRQSDAIPASTQPGITRAGAWRAREPLRVEQRVALRAAIAQHSHRLESELSSCADMLIYNMQPYIHRQAVRRALIECGLLSITRRSITLPITRRNLAKIS
jgi:transposase InsO family protein